MKRSLFIFLFFLLFKVVPAQELPLYGALLKGYPSSLIIPKWKFRIGLSFGKVNDAIDVFDVRKQEVGGSLNAVGLGDYDHYGGFLNLGLADTLMASGSYLHRFIQYGHGTISIHSYEFFIRKSFWSVLSIDFGVRGNILDGEKVKNVDDINFYIHRYNPNVSIEVDPYYIWFTKKTETGEITSGVAKGENPYVSLYDSWDLTNFLRLTVGKTYRKFQPNIFIEYGKTDIHGKIDTNLKYYVPKGFEDSLPELPVNLNRDETYLKLGFNSFLKTPFNTLTYFEYYYLMLFRDDGLGYEHYNHVFRLEVNYFFNRHLVLSLGGIYLHRQLNGIIPLLYNKYTQTTFDHKYGWAEAGITFMW